jgi:SWI/SNF-related matrix-associated actin-dependent regulator of chromatin subfamily A member 5
LIGINLTRASHVIMCDSDWNPQNDLQAIARAHRIGQTKTVQVYRLICRGSVEDQMLDRIRRKLFLSLKVMSSSDNPGSNEKDAGDKGPHLASGELMDILRKGSSALSGVGERMSLDRFLDAGIEEILELSRERGNVRDAKLRQDVGDTSDPSIKEEKVEDSVLHIPSTRDESTLLADAEAEQRALLSGVAQVQSRLFEGRVVKRGSSTKSGSNTPPGRSMKRDIKEIAEEWTELTKRARGPNRIVKIDGMEFIVAQSLVGIFSPFICL